MKLINFIKGEFTGFNIWEKVFFPVVIFLIAIVSIYLNDSKIALISAISGVSYTILAGKGKVSCYFIGMIGTICYCYLAYKNGFYGNLILYGFYYFPMEVIGVFKWLKHYDRKKNEIVKKSLNKKERFLYFGIFSLISLVFIYILNISGGKSPVFDGAATIFSILGQLLTVKRCIEQWYVWLLVNILSFIMWLIAVSSGAKCAATAIMWLVYIFLSFYFYFCWRKDLYGKN